MVRACVIILVVLIPAVGEDRETSWRNAHRDYMGGKPELALQEFTHYVHSFPDSPEAATARYYIGKIYFDAGQFDDARKALDAALKFAENPSTPEAIYFKGVSLMKLGRRWEAGTIFHDFVRRYPQNERIPEAHRNLRLLGLEGKR